MNTRKKSNNSLEFNSDLARLKERACLKLSY